MRYCIGEFELELKTQWMPLQDDELMEEFPSRNGGEAQLAFREEILDPEMLSGSRILKRTGGYELLETDQGLFLLNHWAKCRYAYGIWLKELQGETPIYFNPDMKNQIPLYVSYLLSTVGLHRKFLDQNIPVIHASFVNYQGKAILFLGSSGQGKSTQASLWNRFANAQIINGDRALLREHNGIWYAHGYPCCGSSDICLNEKFPIVAAVVLDKAAENTIQDLPLSRKICALVSGTEFYPWDNGEVDSVFRIAENLASKIPLIQLSCRPDEGAVEVLKNYLERFL